MDTLSQKADYFKEKESVKYLILRTNQDNILSFNYMVLIVMFKVKNNTFMEQLRIVIQEDDTTKVILKKIG